MIAKVDKNIKSYEYLGTNEVKVLIMECKDLICTFITYYIIMYKKDL